MKNKNLFILTPSSSYASLSSLLRQTTRELLNQMVPSDFDDPATVQDKIMERCRQEVILENANRSKGEKLRAPEELTPAQIADILYAGYPVAKIAIAGLSMSEEQDVIGLYQTDGPEAGIYSTSKQTIEKHIRMFNYSITQRGINETIAALQTLLKRTEPCSNKDLLAVNNGIYDYKTKTLMPFDPSYVFLSKSHVDYNPNAKNVVIHNPDDNTDWDVESWMKDLNDDPEVVELFWQILGAVIRPNVPFGRSVWFYAESGNNGKGTLCELMRQICGEGTYTSLPLTDFGKEFALEPLIGCSAIIVDENDVGIYIDKAANLKALVTGDVITVNRKFKTPIPFRFRGFMVQCLNEMPRIKDRTDSFFRRQIFVPFKKSFTGKERKYIKNDYLHRKDVLEYVLYKVLHEMNYYELIVPESCKAAMEEYQDFVDPVRAFLNEMLPKVQWDLLPYAFLYDLFVAWYKKTSGGDRNTKSKRSFIKEVNDLVEKKYTKWDHTNDKYPVTIWTGSNMNAAEPLILDYNLDDWKSPRYKDSSDVELVCHPMVNLRYKGLYRKQAQGCSDEELEAKAEIDTYGHIRSTLRLDPPKKNEYDGN